MKIKLINFKSIKSTNDKALNLIKKNKIEPTLISSDQQTKGRGTMGKNGYQKKVIYFYQFFLNLILKE